MRHIRYTASGQQFRFYTDDVVPQLMPAIRSFISDPTPAPRSMSEAGEVVDQRIRQYQAQYPAATYTEGRHEVLRQDPALKAAYAGTRAPAEPPQPLSPEAGQVARKLTDAKTRLYMLDHPAVSYPDALHAVLDADRELKDAYHRS